ncbi:MAG: ribbon-helix-helix protein, CopG family [Methylocystis sp.]|mgnify:CR=1 FL=1|uniref:ribbon-helix-helix protein, CopG family n=1 Tax=Methylocystis sp. TaxID=1911079 RepID=UPI00394CB710
MTRVRETFTFQVDSALLAQIGKLAKQEGRQAHAVIEDALRAHVALRSRAKSRPHVMNVHRSSLQRYGVLYEKLAE